MFIRYETPNDVPQSLKMYCVREGAKDWFNHPFWRYMFPFDCEPSLEAFLQTKEQSFKDRIEQGELSGAIDDLNPLGYPIKYFVTHVAPAIPKTEAGDLTYWQLLEQVWRRSTTVHGFEEYAKKAFQSNRTNKLEGLCGERYSDYIELCEPITAWRGVSATSVKNATNAIRNGFSWTLSKDKANWFADRDIPTIGDAYVAECEFHKHEIHAYFDGSEEEIVVVPSEYRNFRWIEP